MLDFLKQSPVSNSPETITLPNGQLVGLTLRHNKRAKRLILRFDPISQGVIVTLPAKATLKHALRFVDQHENWVMTQMEKSSPSTKMEEGAIIPIEGIEYKIFHNPDKRFGVEMTSDGEIYVAGTKDHLARRLTDFLKKQARSRLQIQVDLCCDKIHTQHRRIAIRDTKSRWGSCATNGNLNFSWRLILASPEILNYVAAHEVAHLREHNHSPAFWAVVKELDPNWKKSRDWLKSNGAKLHAYH